MYSLSSFGSMMLDKVRMGAYVEALRRAVKPGDVVVDIGTGTGIFALIACQLGAKHVYAFEPNPLIELGKPMAEANGFADRITFIKEYTTRYTLPEQADVIVGDIRGRLPFLYPNISTYHDAMQRMLKPGGILIPQRDHLYAAYLTQPELYRQAILMPWAENPYGLDMRAALPLIVNSVGTRIAPEKINVALPGQHWQTLEYGQRTEVRAGGELEWMVETAAALHFLYVWFEAELIDGVRYSAAPGAPESPEVYGYMLFPLQSPVEVQPGERVRLNIDVDLLSDDYIYRWATAVYPPDAKKARVQYTQSTFFSQPLLNMHKRSPNHTPTLSISGRLQAYVLGEMAKGTATVAQIAQSALVQFPDSGHDQSSMLSLVANLSQSFSQ
jgi:protein arginine N-methyltransferase 1